MAEKLSTDIHKEEYQLGEQLKEAHEAHTERLREKLERTAEQQQEHLPNEQAALQAAKEFAADEHAKHLNHAISPAERRRGPLSKKQLDNSFTTQMSHVRAHLSSSEKVLSRVIHTKPIEVASDFINSTIARPNALLTGSIVAFLTVTILYFTANYYGFTLSGFETIGAFVVGWLLGLIYDYASVAFKRRDRR